MDGDSEPHFRDYRYDLPQDTQLFGRHLSHHHRDNGYYRVHQQVKITPELKTVVLVSIDSGLSDGGWWRYRRDCLVEGTNR